MVHCTKAVIMSLLSIGAIAAPLANSQDLTLRADDGEHPKHPPHPRTSFTDPNAEILKTMAHPPHSPPAIRARDPEDPKHYAQHPPPPPPPPGHEPLPQARDDKKPKHHKHPQPLKGGKPPATI
ncbi:hypothetical protein K491DRAFT_505745 [Lophiostoma macrostomum CBS 122681]|uniref:Uncharacterized protein n=1 Tax=Lophiostoma macrostomum CBS 122681 TaxID=1314788 RepID=A0A6A6TMS1_9PLEO|nr:hypothetical protein K491DRAFT_505745 [Lophiostoma macrostomum CBS 122681]